MTYFSDQNMKGPVEQTKVHTLVYTCPVDHVGTSVFVKGWLVPEKQNRPVILIHDLGESAGHLADFAMHLARLGYSTYSFDMRGHGQSGRRLGHVSSFGQLSLDLLQVAAWVRHKEQGRRPVIIAQGMGSLVAIFFAKSFSKYCSSMVLISPMFALRDTVSPFRRFLLKKFADFLPISILPRKLCPVFTYIYDKQSSARVQPKITGLFAYELLNFISKSRKILNRHKVPTLFLCPDSDDVCHYDFLKKVLQKPQHHGRHRLLFLKSDRHQLMSSGSESFHLMEKALLDWMRITDDTKPAEISAVFLKNLSQSQKLSDQTPEEHMI